MAKRRRAIITWRTFEHFLIQSFTRPSPTQPGRLFLGSLRGYLMDDKRWGIAARPELWPKLRKHIRLPFGQQDWSLDATLGDPLLIAQTLGPSRQTRKAARQLIALWGPLGPLKIPRRLWLNDRAFQNWLDSRGTK